VVTTGSGGLFNNPNNALIVIQQNGMFRGKLKMTGDTKEEIINHWQGKLDIHFGMSKEEAFEKFRGWREKKKTCQRCEGEKLIEFCPIHLICKEADNVRDAERNDNRGRTFKTDGLETVRTGLSEARKRASIR